MKLLDVLYYHYYLYSVKILWEDEPYATTNWMLSFSEALLVNGLFDIILAKFFCIRMGKWYMILIFLIILISNYFYYNRSGRSRKVVIEKPLLFESSKISFWVMILFFLISVSSLFWIPFYSEYLLAKCN